MSCLPVGPLNAPQVQAIDKYSMSEEAALLRRDIIEALYACGGGHYGGSLSVIDVLLVLYRRVLRVTPAFPGHPDRDRLILSKGHAAIALYAVLRRGGFFTDALSGYGHAESRLEGHPDMATLPGVDFSTGSLGQGLSVGLGMAMAVHAAGSHVWVVLGDGECQEGQVWETAMLASRYRAGNLHAVVDVNGFQECGWPPPHRSNAPPVDNLAQRWKSFGWRVWTVDGHDHRKLCRVFTAATVASARPTVVLARSRKGKGFSLIEANPLRFHCTTVTNQEHAALLETLQ
jgi:transketolase